MLAPKLGRRAFVQGLTGVRLAAILANPTLARAAAAGLQAQTVTTPGDLACRARQCQALLRWAYDPFI